MQFLKQLYVSENAYSEGISLVGSENICPKYLGIVRKCKSGSQEAIRVFVFGLKKIIIRGCILRPCLEILFWGSNEINGGF